MTVSLNSFVIPHPLTMRSQCRSTAQNIHGVGKTTGSQSRSEAPENEVCSCASRLTNDLGRRKLGDRRTGFRTDFEETKMRRGSNLAVGSPGLKGGDEMTGTWTRPADRHPRPSTSCPRCR